MSMYGKYPKVVDGDTGEFVEQKVWPSTSFVGDPGLTVQADRDDADINKIISRFQKSGVLPPTAKGEPFFGDVSEIGDLQDAIIKVQEADELFMQYPADLRERFNNSPVEFVEFMSDPENLDEAVQLGLAVRRPVEPVVAPVPPAASPA